MLGQRQLVALSSLLFEDLSDFILEEAKATVARCFKTQIQEGQDAILSYHMVIAIAHQLLTVKHAGRIPVSADGRIIEEGTHDALIDQGGHYAELYNTYFRHQSLEYINEAKWRVTLEPEELAAD